MTKKPLNPNAQKWVAALRSGKYKQGQGLLNCDGKFCCLGVACEIAIESGVKVPKSKLGHIIRYDSFEAVCPDSVQAFLGLKSPNGSIRPGGETLAYLNDHGKTFLEIADLIESQPEGLFND